MKGNWLCGGKRRGVITNVACEDDGRPDEGHGPATSHKNAAREDGGTSWQRIKEEAAGEGQWATRGRMVKKGLREGKGTFFPGCSGKKKMVDWNETNQPGEARKKKNDRRVSRTCDRKEASKRGPKNGQAKKEAQGQREKGGRTVRATRRSDLVRGRSAITDM